MGQQHRKMVFASGMVIDTGWVDELEERVCSACGQTLERHPVPSSFRKFLDKHGKEWTVTEFDGTTCEAFIDPNFPESDDD